MSYFMVTMALMLQSAGDVKITGLDGNSIDGQLRSISSGQVTVETAGGAQSLALDAVMAIDLISGDAKSSDPALAVADAGQIWMHDGSRVAASAVTRTAQDFLFDSPVLGEQSLPAEAVRAVRLAVDDKSLTSQWQTFLQRDGQKDLLIVPKRDGSGLDFLAGIVSAISTEQVSFLLDGDTIPVPIARVYGVVFASPVERSNKPQSVVQLRSGDQLAAKAILFDGAQFRITSSWGSEVRLNTDVIRRIDFSSGRIQYVSDLEPLREEFDGIDPDGSLFSGLIDPATARMMYGPRRDSTMDPRQKIRLRNRRFDKGLCLHSRTTLSYALDRNYESLEAIVGVDDEVAFNQVSQVSLKISADGEVVFEKVFQTDEDPVNLKLPMAGVSTLTILVDYADGDSSCDWLDLADAKLIRVTEAK